MGHLAPSALLYSCPSIYASGGKKYLPRQVRICPSNHGALSGFYLNSPGLTVLSPKALRYTDARSQRKDQGYANERIPRLPVRAAWPKKRRHGASRSGRQSPRLVGSDGAAEHAVRHSVSRRTSHAVRRTANADQHSALHRRGHHRRKQAVSDHENSVRRILFRLRRGVHIDDEVL